MGNGCCKGGKKIDLISPALVEREGAIAFPHTTQICDISSDRPPKASEACRTVDLRRRGGALAVYGVGYRARMERHAGLDYLSHHYHRSDRPNLRSRYLHVINNVN